MKVCDVVIDSIWYDPRVKKQINSYIQNGCDLECVGIIDNRYKKEEVEKIPCKVRLAEIVASKKRSILNKVMYQYNLNAKVYREILKTKADVIHANDLNALVPAYYASKKMKSKLIYDTHEIWLENINMDKNKPLKAMYTFFEKHLIGKVDLVVCVSNAAAGYFKDKYKIKLPMVVTNCIDKERHITENVQKAEKKQVLNHGQFYAGRGYDLMIAAAPLLQKYEDIDIVLRGFGVSEEQFKKQAEDTGCKNIVFEPPVKVEELVEYASKAWVALAVTEPINLNFKYSVSNKIFEYAAAGLPVIMSDIPEHRYLNDKYNFGIVLKENTPEEIAKAVEKLYNDEEFYNRCSENAHKLSFEVNWENEFEKLLEFEYQLINNK